MHSENPTVTRANLELTVGNSKETVAPLSKIAAIELYTFTYQNWKYWLATVKQWESKFLYISTQIYVAMGTRGATVATREQENMY